MASHHIEGDLQLGPDGRWRVFHKMIGAGHQGQWVYSQEMDSWLREDVGAKRVEGSGANIFTEPSIHRRGVDPLTLVASTDHLMEYAPPPVWP